MKNKFINVLSIIMVIALLYSVNVFADNDNNTNSAVKFFITCFDDDDKEFINIPNISTSVSNDVDIENDFELHIDENVTEDTILSYVTKAPEDEEAFKNLHKILEKENYYIRMANGELIDISELTEDKFEIEWYSIYYDDHWQINGRIIDSSTKEEVTICEDDDDDDDDDDDEINGGEDTEKPPVLPEYTSDFAYIFGYNDTNMGAEGSLLRCEVSAMIHRLVKQNDKLDGFYYNESNAPIFADIDGEWFRSAIEFMNYKGAFNVEKGSNVYPYSPITRGETFKLVCIGLGFTKDTTLSEDEYAKLMYDSGYILGDENGDLNISKLINRAEFCAIYNRVIGRDDVSLVTKTGEEITAETYGFTDLSEDAWYYEIMLRATSAYDENGYVDINLRGIRNNLDDYE